MQSVRVAAVTRRATLALVVVVALLALPAFAGAVTKPPTPKRQAALAFKVLRLDTSAVPRKNLAKRHRRDLLRLVKKAKRQSVRKPCASVKTLRTYRRRLKRIREPKLKRFELSVTTIRGALEADALTANVALLQLPRSRKCGGGRKSTVTQAAPRVLESDALHVRLKVALPSPTFAPHKVGGTTYQQMFMTGMGETGNVGEPGLPQITQFLGVPQGADVKVTLNSAQGYDLGGVNLMPTQEQPLDGAQLPSGAPDPGTFEDPPFEKSGKAYKSDKKFPASPTDGGGVGSMRDLLVGGVDLAGGQYQPKSDKLHVFTTLDVTVDFGGNNSGSFGHADDFTGQWNSWFQQNYKGLIDNYDTVVDNVGPAKVAPFCGEEMLVITSPALEPAANALASAKQAQGYFAKVKLTGSAPGQIGTTKEQIQSFIRGELTGNCLVRPQYVVLLGNTDAVPTFLVPCTQGGSVANCNVASDLPYSLDGVGSDLFADVMLGRIPATDPANAAAVVSKIVNYENTMPAPAGDDFYKHATVTGYFQPQRVCVLDAGKSGTPNCNPDNGAVNGHLEIVYSNHRDVRGFTLTSDRILRAMTAESYEVDRLWTTDDDKVTPEQYYDNTDIPFNLRRPQLAWDAGTEDLLGAYNGGRFLILHRDHGWPDGWAAPTLSSDNIPQLSNGSKLPVVFGIDCSSATFDNPANPSFVEEQIELPTNGAVAGFGDTRESPSFPNNHMALGFFDALFPGTVGNFGSSTPTRRLGDVLLSGKAYMATQQGLDFQGAGDTYKEHYLYHLLGDPSMQMWAATPQHFDTAKIASKYRTITPVNPGDPVFQVETSFPTEEGEPPAPGTVATLFHGGDPIGRGVVGGDSNVTIVPDTNTDASNLTVRFQQDGVLPAEDDVQQGTPAQQTTLTLQGPANVKFDKATTFSGHLDPGFAGASVKVVYARDSNGETIEHTVTPDAGGDYTDSVTVPRAKAGKWHAQASYAGDNTHGASTSNTVAFAVGS
jgi:Peptidase family C25/Propeptide_C25